MQVDEAQSDDQEEQIEDWNDQTDAEEIVEGQAEETQLESSEPPEQWLDQAVAAGWNAEETQELYFNSYRSDINFINNWFRSGYILQRSLGRCIQDPIPTRLHQEQPRFEQHSIQRGKRV